MDEGIQKKKKNTKGRLPFLLIPLAAFSFLSYGLLSGKLGIYWDDWAYLWTRIELGYQGLLRHFSFSRPVAGQIHNIAMLITGKNPIRIQIYGMLLRIIGSYAAASLVYYLWDCDLLAAALFGLFFIAYPGFTMQPIAINFSFSYFLMGILALSFLLSLWAYRKGGRQVLLTCGSLLLEALNLFASEYFFMLEFMRPLVLWVDCGKENSGFKSKLRKVIQADIPYLMVLMISILYRIFFNRTQTSYYQFSLLDQIKSNPVSGIAGWFLTMIKDCWKVILPAWSQIFKFPVPSVLGKKTFLVYILISVFIAFLSFIVFSLFQRCSEAGKRNACQMIVLGLVSLPLAGQPFWLTDTQLSFVFQNSRYTLPFIPGVSLILAGIFCLFRKNRWVPSLLAAILIGLAAGYHFNNANAYRRDWTLTKDFFWQLKWRVPEMKENTVVVTNVLPIRFSTDNSLTAPLNWIYADGTHDGTMPFMLYTNTKREKTLSDLQSGKEVFQEYLSAQFFGNTNDMISVNYSAPGCVHILDPEVDVYNQMIPEIDREAAALNNYDRIIPDGKGRAPDSEIFGHEPAHNWCWYYENVDLSRQRKDWKKAAELSDQAFTISDHYNDPMELLPIIESYAYIGAWDKAFRKTKEAYTVTPVMNDPLCVLWNRIEKDTGRTEEQVRAIEQKDQILDCRLVK